jgi:hypothetical protein
MSETTPDVEDDAQPDDVTISAETARTSLTEVEAAIRRTGGPDASGDNACSPLALARQKVEASSEVTGQMEEHVIGLLQEVSDERGVEISNADPLVGATFEAEKELKKTFSVPEEPKEEADGEVEA